MLHSVQKPGHRRPIHPRQVEAPPHVPGMSGCTAPTPAPARLPLIYPFNWALLPGGALPPAGPHTQGELDALVRKWCGMFGVRHEELRVVVTRGIGLHAGAFGWCAQGRAQGLILVDEATQANLTRSQMEYVIAHEFAHIWRGHLRERLTMQLVRNRVNAKARRSLEGQLLVGLYDLVQIAMKKKGSLAPFGAMMMRHELEADVVAIALTGDREAAFAALRTLAGGNDDAESHTWDVLGQPLSVMTVGQRIAFVGQILDLIPAPAPSAPA